MNLEFDVVLSIKRLGNDSFPGIADQQPKNGRGAPAGDRGTQDDPLISSSSINLPGNDSACGQAHGYYGLIVATT